MKNKKKFRILGTYMNIPSFSLVDSGGIFLKVEKFQLNIPELAIPFFLLIICDEELS